MKGNRHTEPQRGVSERNRRKAAALSAEMGSLSRSITRRSDQNCKIILQILILQFCRQLVKKVQKDFFDKLRIPRRLCLRGIPAYSHSPKDFLLEQGVFPRRYFV